MDTDGPALRHVVRDRRLALGKTQAQLAEEVGKSQRWLSDLERGLIDTPRRQTMHALASALHLPVEDFYVAVGMAQTREGARRIIASEPPGGPAEASATTPSAGATGGLEADDPVLDIVMLGVERLTPDGIRRLREHLEEVERLRRKLEEDAARDGP